MRKTLKLLAAVLVLASAAVAFTACGGTAAEEILTSVEAEGVTVDVVKRLSGGVEEIFGRIKGVSANDAQTVILPSEVTYDGDKKASVKEIGALAFYKSSLTEIVLPEGFERILPWAFAYSEKLTVVTLPSTLKEIGEYAFSGISSLKQVTVGAVAPPTLGVYAFKLYDGKEYITSPDLRIEVPKGADYSTWNEYGNHIFSFDNAGI
jgi:hypothetical protein